MLKLKVMTYNVNVWASEHTHLKKNDSGSAFLHREG